MAKLILKTIINYRTYVLLICGFTCILSFVAMPVDEADIYGLIVSKLISFLSGVLFIGLYNYWKYTRRIDALVEFVHRLPDWIFGEDKQQ